MLIKFCIGLFWLLLCYGMWSSRFAQSRPPSAAITSGTEPAAAKSIPAFDACSLINNSEIASVQGTAVQQTQPTGYAYGDLDISQCYYTAISRDGKNLSVHLQVIQRNSKSARRDAVSEFWNARFRRGREDNERKEAREEEEEDAPKAPISVHGIGSAAFWLASSRGGALFVRKDDQLVRVSVGGSDDAKIKISKSKILAKKALARLK